MKHPRTRALLVCPLAFAHGQASDVSYELTFLPLFRDPSHPDATGVGLTHAIELEIGS